MNTLVITKKSLDKHGYYVGPHDLTNFDGNLITDDTAGLVRFNHDVAITGNFVAGDSINVAGNLKVGGEFSGAGFVEVKYSIKIGGSIETIDFIRSGDYIDAGAAIRSGGTTEAEYSIKAGGVIDADVGDIVAKCGHIKSGGGIHAGNAIKAKTYINSTNLIEASKGGIKAQSGINAGLYIYCKTLLQCHGRVFAGICVWTLPSPNQKVITCGKFQGGTIEYGTLVETGIAQEKVDSRAEAIEKLEAALALLKAGVTAEIQ